LKPSHQKSKPLGEKKLQILFLDDLIGGFGCCIYREEKREGRKVPNMGTRRVILVVE